MSLEYDPVEDTPKYQAVCARIEDEARSAMQADGLDPDGFGSCHVFWAHKKRLLWKRHRIRWRTPSEMNPYVMFD